MAPVNSKTPVPDLSRPPLVIVPEIVLVGLSIVIVRVLPPKFSDPANIALAVPPDPWPIVKFPLIVYA